MCVMSVVLRSERPVLPFSSRPWVIHGSDRLGLKTHTRARQVAERASLFHPQHIHSDWALGSLHLLAFLLFCCSCYAVSPCRSQTGAQLACRQQPVTSCNNPHLYYKLLLSRQQRRWHGQHACAQEAAARSATAWQQPRQPQEPWLTTAAAAAAAAPGAQ
jgi:hypothetical protein